MFRSSKWSLSFWLFYRNHIYTPFLRHALETAMQVYVNSGRKTSRIEEQSQYITSEILNDNVYELMLGSWETFNFETKKQSHLLNAGFLLGLCLDPEAGGVMSLRNVGWLSTDYTALYPGRHNYSKCWRIKYFKLRELSMVWPRLLTKAGSTDLYF
jgi:hypothetical protein